MTERRIEPQKGPQSQFLRTPADICIYGGAAGGGKTFGLLLEPLRHVHNPEFRAVIFRRESTQIENLGGLWDESHKLYPLIQGVPKGKPAYSWRFGKRGPVVRFAHLQRESHKLAWQGGQVPFIGFDELTHFTESQFFYMVSRNRSTSGVRGYIRATTNPDPDSWVAKFIQWWWDEKTGYAIPERSGKLRWFIRDEKSDGLIWADTDTELFEKYNPSRDPKVGQIPKSVTFIRSSVFDNPALLEVDPGYLSNLRALPMVERERLLHGNWLIRAQAGNCFRRGWFRVVDAAPFEADRIRYWDRAGTEDPEELRKREEKGGSGDPDFTVGLRLSRDASGIFYVEHVHRFRGTPGEVEKQVRNITSQDGYGVSIGIEQDPGQAGKAEAGYYTRLLAGYDVHTYPVSKDKLVRSKPARAQAEAGNIRLVRGAWNEDFLKELENFPGKGHDDQVDALSGALSALMEICGDRPMVG